MVASYKQFAEWRQEQGKAVLGRGAELRRQAAMKTERARRLLAEALEDEEAADKADAEDRVN